MAMNTMDGTPPAGGNEMPEGPEAGGGYKLCLLIGGDGAMSVVVESSEEDAMEGAEPAPTAEAEAGEYKPVESLAEAMAMFKAIMANDGKMPEDTGAQDMASAKTGYARLARKDNAAPSPGAVFGD